jgi:hypothetical protein
LLVAVLAIGIDVTAGRAVCSTPVAALRVLPSVAALSLGVNVGTVLWLSVEAAPFFGSSVQCLVADATGRLVQLNMYNCMDGGATTAEAEMMFPRGARIGLREPYYKMFNSGFIGLRVDNKRNVVVEMPLAAAGGARDASAFKDTGNRHFAAGAFAAAAAAYTAALDGSGAATDGALRQALLSNRAAARLQVGDAAGALADCDAALAVDPAHGKAAYRKGAALLALRRFEDAAAWLESFAAAAADAPSFSAAAERARACVAQRRGTFDWLRLSFDARDGAAAQVANFVHAALDVRMSRGKGRGLYVARSVQAGTLLLVEQAAALRFEVADVTVVAAEFSVSGRSSVNSGSQHAVCTDLTYRAATDERLNAQLSALYSGGRESGGGGGAGPPAVPPMRLFDEAAADGWATAAPVSAHVIRGIVEKNAFGVKRSPAPPHALRVAMGALPDTLRNDRQRRAVRFVPRTRVMQLAAEPTTAAELAAAIRDAAATAGALDVADVSSRSTALHCAVCRGDATTAGLLLRGGAKATVADEWGFTPLHYAAGQYFSARIVRDLLAHGADAHASSATCLTPLHAAVACGRADAVRLLLDAGASPWVEDVRGLSPHAMAAEDNEPDLLAAFAGRGSGEAKGTGVWLLASFMNHADEINTLRRITGRSMFVYASRDLAAGAELTTMYSASKKALAEAWGIR